jgi:translation initiation factor 4A
MNKNVLNENEETQKEVISEEILETNWDECIETFDELGLKPDLLRGIYGYGFEKPSPIQQKAILPVIKGRDVIAQAQSGTGKTATFAIGTLELIDTALEEVQTLVLAPTRELAQQISIVYQFLGEFLKVKVHLLIGGTEVKNNINKLKSGGCHIVVGCPGRVLDMIKKKHLSLSSLRSFVLDEADEMLSKGFLDNIKEIITYIPPSTKVLLFSATMPKEIVSLTTLFMENPAKILVKNEELTLEGIKQYFVYLKKEDKLDVLIQIYRGIEIAQAIIYCNSKNNVDYVSNELQKKGHMVSSIHSDKKQIERDQIMRDFRSGATRVLVTTDLLARGIDVYQVSLVINYDLPREKETYIHRIGRSGRFGRKGNAINFVTPAEKEDLEALQKFYNTTIEALPSDLSELK